MIFHVKCDEQKARWWFSSRVPISGKGNGGGNVLDGSLDEDVEHRSKRFMMMTDQAREPSVGPITNKELREWTGKRGDPGPGIPV